MSVAPYLVAVWLLVDRPLRRDHEPPPRAPRAVPERRCRPRPTCCCSPIGYRTGGTAPIFADIPPGTPVVDPVVQALTLTDVVVEATVSAVLFALAVQAHRRFGTADPDGLGALRG